MPRNKPGTMVHINATLCRLPQRIGKRDSWSTQIMERLQNGRVGSTQRDNPTIDGQQNAL